ncbi:mannose-6-phosphate isomerase [Acrasis kona]|uniref:mannose-6-phosphate isomerase n=1 Tax=Acrasis kona TaxID=1008807 RepID=A0AAW2YU19_9EUKA
MIRIECKAQNYDWGKKGSESAVAQLVKDHQDIDEKKPYAELWMGTHPSGPSYVSKDEKKIKLSEYLQEQVKTNGADKVFGPHVVKEYPKAKDGDLPFLFKILSVNQALSIQAHPDLKLAEQLHRDFPDHYKDDNHKPELTVALTKFEALCAFRSLEQIIENINKVEPLKQLIGEDKFNSFQKEVENVDDKSRKELLQKVFKALMTSDESQVKTQLLNHESRIKQSSQSSDLDQLFIKLHKTYQGDVGCFAIYFLNVVNLEIGEGLFLGPNEPHAYLYGDCVECMACSDNVVRAGLTPKFMHIDVLCDMLTYNDRSLEKMSLGTGRELNGSVRRFSPTVKEFMVDRIEVSSKALTWKVASISILIVVEGDVHLNTQDGSLKLKKGDVYLVPANYEWTAESENKSLVFVAACNDDLLLNSSSL